MPKKVNCATLLQVDEVGYTCTLISLSKHTIHINGA